MNQQVIEMGLAPAAARPAQAKSSFLWTRLGHLPAFALFVLVTLVMTWPYGLQIQTSLFNWTDALLNVWTLGWGTHALLTDPLNVYQANIFYPYANTLAYSESLLPQTAVAMPIILISGLPSFAHNLLALASFVLAAFGMYLLVYDLTRSRGAGLVAGMVYTFTSYKMMHMSQLQLLSSQWMPFALLYLRRMLNPALSPKGNLGTKLQAAFLYAFFFSLQALSSFYYAFFIAIASGLYIVYLWVLHFRPYATRRRLSAATPLSTGSSSPGIPPQGKASIRDAFQPNWGVAGRLVFSLVLIALFVIPPSLPYFSVQSELGLQRNTADVEYYAASVRTYLSVPAGNWLYSRWLAPARRITGSTESDFVGFIALGLALAGLLARSGREKEKWFYLLLAVVSLILSFGARNEILFFPRWPRLTLPFYLPYRYLFEWMPGFRAMRGPDRFAYLVVLGLAVFAGYGARALAAKFEPRRALVFATPLLLVALIGLENISIPLQATNPATLARAVPDFARWIAQSEPGGVVLEIPMIYQKQPLAWPQYYSLFHRRKLVNGFSGFFPPGYDALDSSMQGFPSETSLALLDELGVGTVVVHNDLLSPAARAALKTRSPAFEPRLQAIQHFGQDDIYRLNGRGGAWGKALAEKIPEGARVWLDNTREDRREFFELASAFLRGRILYGEANATFRTLMPLDPEHPAEFVILNAEASTPAGFTRRVWANDYLAVYAR